MPDAFISLCVLFILIRYSVVFANFSLVPIHTKKTTVTFYILEISLDSLHQSVCQIFKCGIAVVRACVAKLYIH